MVYSRVVYGSRWCTAGWWCTRVEGVPRVGSPGPVHRPGYTAVLHTTLADIAAPAGTLEQAGYRNNTLGSEGLKESG